MQLLDLLTTERAAPSFQIGRLGVSPLGAHDELEGHGEHDDDYDADHIFKKVLGRQTGAAQRLQARGEAAREDQRRYREQPARR